MQLKNKMDKRIIITEEQLEFIKKHIDTSKNNNVDLFKKEVKVFLHALLTNGSVKDTSDYWIVNGINKNYLKKLLVDKYKIVEKNETGEFMIPKRNFDKKISRLYYELFQDTEPVELMREDDGGGAAGGESGGEVGGGTSTSSVGGSYEQPIFGVQRRKIGNSLK